MNQSFKYLIAFLVVITPLFGSAQPEGKKKPPTEKEREDKIDKLKIAFISQELTLTTEEAEKFWPIYNELEAKIKELRKANRKIEKEVEDNYDKLSEEDAEKKFDEVLANEEKEIALRKEYNEKFSKVIGHKRTLKLLSLEREFKRELLDALREQGPPPPPPHHGRPNDR
ncbi:MAG: sensor of ECF-type sigma factor [Fluviicola sp.]|jgi:predicted RNase H-like nuclease (RuvC/YqgF family)|nr:sensor of ECF-type sigma factor [Fluviicola sp.]